MKKAAKVSVIVLSVIAFIVATAISLFFVFIHTDIRFPNVPELDLSRLTSHSRTVTILGRDGQPIEDALYDSNKVYVCIDDLPSHTRDAFVAIEDKRFFKHSGIDYRRVLSALVANIKSGRFSEGASTITQQLIKNTYLSNEKTLKRKLHEMRLAVQLERRFDKNSILENYFNVLYFGSGIRGLGTASRVMFGISASELDLAQSAALAAIINNPSKYSPYNNPNNLETRKNLVLKQMRDQGYITQSECESACSEQLEYGKNKQNQFTVGLIKEACAALGCTEKQLFSDSYTIRTQYDKDIVDAARKAISGMDDFDGIVRVLVLDNGTGGIVCDETNSDKYINPRRSPASAIKPFVAYAPALENGYYPLSQISDEKTTFGSYAPHNYKNIYRGYQSLTECLVYSSNIAAVKLLDDVGVERGKSVAEKFGIPFGETDKSLSIALGGMQYGVTLTELADAYRTLANGGIYSKSNYLQTIKKTDGSAVYVSEKPNIRAVQDDTAYLLTDMLMKCAKYGTAKRLKNSGIIAAKTGTNGGENGNSDCYCVAYTPEYTIAVWFGAKENKLLGNKITGAACSNIVKYLCDTANLTSEKTFDMPDSVAYYDIDDKTLHSDHEVYLADPFLPKRYRRRVLLSKRHLPSSKNTGLDYWDGMFWRDYVGDCDIFDEFFG